MNKKNELTLLTEGQIFKKPYDNQIDVIKKFGTKAKVTDLCILTGCYICEIKEFNVDNDLSLKGRSSWFWTSSYNNGPYADHNVIAVDRDGNKTTRKANKRTGSIRPVLRTDDFLSIIYRNSIVNSFNIEEVEFGEYPQFAAPFYMRCELEKNYKNGMKKTGNTYTFDRVKYDDCVSDFMPITYDEYEYEGKKYIRVIANTFDKMGLVSLSNGERTSYGDYTWIEVSPVKWLVDRNENLLISKLGLLSGIRYSKKGYKEDHIFDKTELKRYMNGYMIHDLFQNVDEYQIVKISPEEKRENEELRERMRKRNNPYSFKFKEVSEEDIIRGAIESDVAVFLHGASSEGKSSRVKQIDPTCEIIYLYNASPDSLIGKSVYNQQTGEMIDIKPSWLRKLEEKCEKEPDKYHIVFFDEINNALPSVQGIAFNIILDKEVNGKWKLPKNARIVAAGNEMQDSLAANQLAEPLFNRFAHVYIKTTTEGWLKWAKDNNIHPAIRSFVAYKNGKVLRSKYDGQKPNADPRKWEMASKMLYATGQPEMLRALVGSEITREFVEFCNQRVITLQDVLTNNYSEEEIKYLNTSERYATALHLSQVDEENLEVVRDFTKKLGEECRAVFDNLWTNGDESRLEKIAELQLSEEEERGMMSSGYQYH